MAMEEKKDDDNDRNFYEQVGDSICFDNNLNELQKEAATYDIHGHLQIIAGPGTGMFVLDC
jgi:hypothetical protein